MSVDLERLQRRARRTFGDLAVAQAVARVRAIVGLPNVPDSETAAQTALEKLQSGRERPTAAEMAALEFVIRMMRPAPLSKNGRLDPLPSQPGSSTYQPAVTAAWEGFRQRVAPLLYSIGRLDRTAGPNPAVGTGFLVGGDLVLTNHHVLTHLSQGVDELDEGMAVIRFYQEYEGPEPVPACPIVKVVAVHPTLDMALLRVTLPAPRSVLELEAGAVPDDAAVGAIGYPYRDDRNPLFVDAIYEGRYGVKRGALGELMSSGPHLLCHDCSTLGGNSGSPLFALDTGRVVGLHCSGEFMYRNEAVPSADIAEFLRSASGADD
jgi:hypothetical protein